MTMWHRPRVLSSHRERRIVSTATRRDTIAEISPRNHNSKKENRVNGAGRENSCAAGAMSLFTAGLKIYEYANSAVRTT